MADVWGTHTAMVMATSQCIDECLKSHRVCVDTATQCLLSGADYAQPDRVRLLWDCAQISQMTADFLLRKSPFQLQTCELCIDICERTAASCAELEDDRLMRICVQVTRRCASACRGMVADRV